MTFNAPAVKKAIKIAKDMGLIVTGYEIGADGKIKVQIGQETINAADAALNTWSQERNGARKA